MRRFVLGVTAVLLAAALAAGCTNSSAPSPTAQTSTSSAESAPTSPGGPTSDGSPAPTTTPSDSATESPATTESSTNGTGGTDGTGGADGSAGVLPTPADPLPIEDLAAFSGVATMNAGSNCTGTLIDTGVPDGPAYVLTNGHCTGDVGRSAQATTLAKEWFGTAEFLRAKGNVHDPASGTPNDTLTVEVTELAYSTMRQTDTAIVRLADTLGQLEAKGIKPVKITQTEPTSGEKVVNVGVPVQGLLEDQWVLRRGTCTLGAQHTLIEFFWLWYGVWSNDCPGIIQGSSGSPLLTTDSSGAPTEIVGMINTTSWGASAADGGACFINRPCQVTDAGPSMVEKTSYAQSVAGIGSCFNATTGVFATGGDCPLPVSSLWAAQGGGSFRGGDLPDAVGRTPAVELVGRTAGTVRTALAPLGDGRACLDVKTYASATPQPLPVASEDWEQRGVKIDVTLPQTEGHYVYCAVAGDDYAGAASVLFDVDRTPPTAKANADVERLDDGAAIVRPHLNPPEITTVRFTWGPAGTVNCSDTAAFQDFFIVPLTLEPKDLPATYCIYGMDSAGNTTPVTTIDIPQQ